MTAVISVITVTAGIAGITVSIVITVPAGKRRAGGAGALVGGDQT